MFLCTSGISLDTVFGMTQPLNKIKARVERGAALLDKRHPGWAGEIDLPLLDLKNKYHCVIGQLTGNFVKSHELLGMRANHLIPDSGRFLQNRGFYVRRSSNYLPLLASYASLTDEWRIAIVARRIAARQAERERGLASA